MYGYEWDKETGGIRLLFDQEVVSFEPRPVYSRELNILGLNRSWIYENDDSAPYLWAESNRYIYRGRVVAKTLGGSVYDAPKIEHVEEPVKKGQSLDPVDVPKMVARNREILLALEQDAIKRIYNIYSEHRDKVDVFYVAFSGGKDSIVVLDLVQKALPHSDFKVLFGDTRMEFPDTYEVIEKVKEWCSREDIEFLHASSILSPAETWELFGPPSQRIRWCCSVHKTTPQILELRETINKANFRGMAFTGVRGDESAARSKYHDVNLGEKIRGQYNTHPILNWNSAEIFLYTYAHNLIINEAYKKGNGRVGCLVCPMATDKNIFFKEQSYGAFTAPYLNAIANAYSASYDRNDSLNEFMNSSGWKARRSARDIRNASTYCTFESDRDHFIARITRIRSNIHEWIKTIGKVDYIDKEHLYVSFKDVLYSMTVTLENGTALIDVQLSAQAKSNIHFISYLKSICRKVAYCVYCQVCEANCPFGYISMHNGIVTIDSKCVNCRKCLEIDAGCLVASSLRLPEGGNKMGSINRYANMGFENSWIKSFFENPQEFLTNPNIGSKKVDHLKKFLTDSEICVPKTYSLTEFGRFIERIGFDNPISWGLIYSNMAYTAQINWWIKNIEFDREYTQDELIALLDESLSKAARGHVVSAFKNIFISNPILGREIGAGKCEFKLVSGARSLISLTRTSWQNPDARVILYALYKFAEACSSAEGEIYRQFSVRRLLDFSVESDGVSPAEIFGLDELTLTRILTGLSANYPDFILAQFTHDLDVVTLKPEKRSTDVLALFTDET